MMVSMNYLLSELSLNALNLLSNHYKGGENSINEI